MMQNNDNERREMIKQEKIAASFKFGTMAKKHCFMPSMNVKAEFSEEYIKSYDNKLPYLDGRTREALIFPKKVKDSTKLFGLNKTCDGSAFNRDVR